MRRLSWEKINHRRSWKGQPTRIEEDESTMRNNPMRTHIAQASATLLAAAVAGSMLAPATASAAPRSYHLSNWQQRPAIPAVSWRPAGLGTITVRRGHERLASAWLYANRALRDVHIRPFVSRAADGARVIVLPASYFPRLDRGSRVPVHVRIVAGRLARIGVFGADLHVDARPLHSPVRRVANDLDFRVDVDRAIVPPPPPPPPPHIGRVITWSAPRSTLGTITVQRGQTVTETVSFSSTANLTSVYLKDALGAYARAHGLSISVVSPISLTTLAANTPVNAQFAIGASADARTGLYPSDLHVDGRLPGGRFARLPYDLDFRVRVVPYIPVISWTPHTLGTISLQQGQTVTETASFTSSVDLTSVTLRDTLGAYAASHGLTLAVLSPSPAAPINVTANTPVPLTFTLAAAPTARVALYRDRAIYVYGSQGGGAVAGLHYGLHFNVDVDRAPRVTPIVSWSGGSFASLPTVQAGQVATYSAAFSSNVDLTDVAFARYVSARTARFRAPRITVALANGVTTVAANALTQVTVTIDASHLKRGGLYVGDLYVVGRAAGTARHALHYGLHITGAVSTAP